MFAFVCKCVPLQVIVVSFLLTIEDFGSFEIYYIVKIWMILMAL